MEDLLECYINELKQYFNTQWAWIYVYPEIHAAAASALKIGTKQGLIEIQGTGLNSRPDRYMLTAKGQRILYPTNMEDLLECYD